MSLAAIDFRWHGGLPRILYTPPEYNPSLEAFIKSSPISDLFINSPGWKTEEHFKNRLSHLRVYINAWIDKMPA